MKRIPILLLVLVLIPAMLLTGCGGSESVPEAEVQDVVEEEQSEEIAEGQEGMGDLLSAAYVDMMKENKYLMSYKATMEYEGQSTEMEATVAVIGEDMSITSKGEGIESSMIIKGDKIYMIDHAGKTVTSFMQSQDMVDQMDTGAIDAEGINYIGTGKEDGLVFEEYATLNGSMKYFFDGKDLVKIAVDSDDGTMVMEILEMSSDVPAGMFEIPAGYQQIGM
ncbi:MAG: hypothetical protein PHC91_03960 [Eubacteriales bacterium]|nr:hypothetical protein [Eubacteriales bacterium]